MRPSSFPSHSLLDVHCHLRLFRGGALDGITEEGKARIAELGIKKVFDFRAEVELVGKPELVIPGVTVVRNPILKDMDYSPEGVAKTYKSHEDGRVRWTFRHSLAQCSEKFIIGQGFEKMFTQMLEEGGPAFGLILKHIRDRPGEPCIFHCSGEYGFFGAR